MDQTETFCILAGAAAIGAMWYTTSRNQRMGPFRGPPPTECSARVASAKAAAVAPPPSTPAAAADFWEGAWSTDAEAHMKKHSDAVRRLTPAEITRRQRIQPVMPLDTTFAKTRGSDVPTLGRALNADKPRPVSGNCGLFYASEAYADALQAQQAAVVEDPDPLNEFEPVN